MPRPKRRGIQNDSFDDPLRNYSPPTYHNTMQQALCQTAITQMKHQPFTCVSFETPVEQVMRQMDELNVACVMVTKQQQLLGIFSERDVLDKVTDQFDQIKHQPVSTIMTANPMAVRDTDSPAKAIAIMALGGFRHVPILNVDDKVVGIVGPRRINTYLHQYASQP